MMLLSIYGVCMTEVPGICIWKKGMEMAYEGMIAETLSISGNKNEMVSAYAARPTGPGPFPGVVLTHHLPGWSEWEQ